MEVSTSAQSKEITQQRVSFKTAWTLFGVLCALSLGAWWKALTATFLLAIRGDAYTQILFAIPISAVLIALDFRKQKLTAAPAWLAGVGLLLLSTATALVAFNGSRMGSIANDIRLAVEVLALVLWWIGSFLLCFGKLVSRKCLFPLVFLLWLIPMPHVVVDGMVAVLQHGTASLTHAMLASVGIPVTQHGEILSLPGLTIEVAAECSSIRSSLLLVMSSMVMAYLLLRSSWGRATVMLLAGPLAIVKNGLRVFTLSVLTVYVNPAIMNGRLHRQGGVLFLALALLLLLALIWVVRGMETRRRRLASDGAAKAAIGVTQVPQTPLG